MKQCRQPPSQHYVAKKLSTAAHFIYMCTYSYIYMYIARDYLEGFCGLSHLENISFTPQWQPIATPRKKVSVLHFSNVHFFVPLLALRVSCLVWPHVATMQMTLMQRVHHSTLIAFETFYPQNVALADQIVASIAIFKPQV